MISDKSHRNYIIIVVVVVVLLVLAKIIGSWQERGSDVHLLSKHYPAERYILERINNQQWYIYNQQGDTTGILYTGKGDGYNGPVGVLVKTSLDGHIRNVDVLYHSDTPSYFQKLHQAGFLEKLSSLSREQLQNTEQTDVVSGATISSEAVLRAAKQALAIPLQPDSEKAVFQPQKMWLTMFILLTFLAAFFQPRIRPRSWQRYTHWLLMLFTLFYLGFAKGEMLTLSRFAALLSGYLPGLHQHLPFYSLLGASFILFFATRRNIYCQSVCPFGSAQELAGKIGGAKPAPRSIREKWKWIQWSGALLALGLALAMNNPGLAQYEVFGAFFQLTGHSILFIILFITIVASLFIRRPWCRFLCPIDGVFAFLRSLRVSLTRKA